MSLLSELNSSPVLVFFSLLMSCDWFFIEPHFGHHLFTFVLNLNTEDYVLVFLLLFRNNPLLIRIPVVPGVD